MKQRLDSLLQEYVDARKTSALAAIVLDRDGTELYKNTFGTLDLNNPAAPKLTPSTPIAIHSCTKLITAICVMQLVEQGKLHLDDPIEKYLPRIAKLQILEGIKDGKPVLRDAKAKPTILQALTHTTGLSYDFLSPETADWIKATGRKELAYGDPGDWACFETPLMFEPGTDHVYGIGLDWLGEVIASMTGQRFHQYVLEHVLRPLGMSNTTDWTGDSDRLVQHFKMDPAAGGIMTLPAARIMKDPPVTGAGQYLYSTLDDYSAVLLTILNYGTHPKTGVKLLEPATVKDYFFQNQIPESVLAKGNVGIYRGSNQMISQNGHLLPGIKKGWSCGFLINLEETPTGRSAGSGMWAGLNNLYYVIDPTAGKTFYLMASCVPFLDPEFLHLFDAIEREVYGKPAAKEVGEAGSNFAIVPQPARL